MKEIKIFINLKKLIDKVNKYIPFIDGGYYFEIFFASNKISSKPFRVNNHQQEVSIEQSLKIQNICGTSIEFWLKSAKQNAFVASGELSLKEIQQSQESNIDIQVESTKFATLVAQIEIVENIIEKVEVIEKDEEVLKKEVVDLEAEARKQQEEERKRKELEELEALKKAQAKKTIITVTSFGKENEPYF